jgi:hypothetical protein|tara:strand:- start:228 stop:536 length:309 start_codon:yes stop_codon:yes gene_type:complete
MNLITLKIYWDILKIGLIALGTFLLIGMFLSIPLCLLWNWLMPDIFGLPTINVFQTFGLSALITFLSPTKINFNNKKQPTSNVNVDKKVNEAFDKIMSEFKA